MKEFLEKLHALLSEYHYSLEVDISGDNPINFMVVDDEDQAFILSEHASSLDAADLAEVLEEYLQ